jgi:hypothetical protein
MKIKPDRDELLHEVFSDMVPPTFREASLNRALASARRQRTGRRVLRATLALAVAVAVIERFGSANRNPNGPPGQSAVAAAPAPLVQTVPGTKIRLVGDDELLAMFPDRPVALVGPPEHRQFVFLDDPRLRPSEIGGRRKGIKL